MARMIFIKSLFHGYFWDTLQYIDVIVLSSGNIQV